MNENYGSCKAVITSDMKKTLYAVRNILVGKRKISKYYCTNDYWATELDDGTQVMCVPPNKIKNINVIFTKLWIDKNIPEEQVIKELKNKYLGKKESVIWF